MLSVQYTILSDDEVEPEEEEEVEDFRPSKGKKSKSEFSINFDTGDLPIAKRPSEKKAKKPKVDSALKGAAEDSVKQMSGLSQRIALTQKKKSKAAKVETADTENDQQQQPEVYEEEDETDAQQGTGISQREEREYFDVVVGTDEVGLMFSQLGLSRPFLRAIEAMGYVQPTPIQEKVIPYALAGRDICASAATGSGKTAAFALPCLERLLFRPRDLACIRILIITPTRELATQIHEVTTQLAQFTDITCCLICGGRKDVRSQEVTLRQGPDIVVCTPGRMLDHLRNGRGINVDHLDVLILDEADRLLELGFQDEVEEVVKYTPTSRQTLLFSATMTATVQDLIKLSLRRPVRVKTDGVGANASSSGSHSANGDTNDDSNVAVSKIPERLVQEFVKVKSDEGQAEAVVLSLLCHSGFAQTKTIVFCELKKTARRLTVLLNLILNAEAANTEEGDEQLQQSTQASRKTYYAVALHGDLSQPERTQALEAFRHGQARILIATDVAARGLDIPNVQTVLNAEMPRQLATYIHRIGRTARAGKAGRAITLVTDDRRKTLKEILKQEALRQAAKKGQSVAAVDADDNNNNLSTNILSRKVAPAVLHHYTAKVASLEPALHDALLADRAEQKLVALEREAERATHLLEYADEIQSRPQRTWFRSAAQTQAVRALSTQQAKAAATVPSAENSNNTDAEATNNAEDDTATNKRKRSKREGSIPVREALSASESIARMLKSDNLVDLDLERKKEARRAQRGETLGEKSLHRVSRAKRRRQEALLASKEEDRQHQEQQGRGRSDGDGEGGVLSAETKVKMAAKRAKAQVHEKEMAVRQRTAGELAMKKIQVEAYNGQDDYDDLDDGPVRKKMRTKVVRQAKALGNLDLAFESGNTGDIAKRMTKKKQQQLARELEFSNFDPTKRLRKGGKVGTANFKSKKRFKRR